MYIQDVPEAAYIQCIDLLGLGHGHQPSLCTTDVAANNFAMAFHVVHACEVIRNLISF